MSETVHSFFNRALTVAVGALLSIAGFFVSAFIQHMNNSTNNTMLHMAQIQKDIKQIEVSIANVNARLITMDQVRLVVNETVDAKVNQAMLEHVRKAHESSK
jgi:hypothetical protein